MRHIGQQEYVSTIPDCRHMPSYETADCISLCHIGLQEYVNIIPDCRHMPSYQTADCICLCHIGLQKYVNVISNCGNMSATYISEYKNMSRSYRTVGICLCLLQIHN